MARHSKTLLNRRQWLRPNNDWGPDTSIRTRLEVKSYDKDKPVLDGGITMRDCSSTISLYLYADKYKHAVAHLNMMTKLLDEVSQLRDKWAIEMERLR